VESPNNKKRNDLVKQLKEAVVNLAEKMQKMDEVVNVPPEVHVHTPEIIKAEITNPTEKTDTSKIEKQLDKVVQAVEKVEVKPEVKVTVEPAIVNVPPIDLKPFEKIQKLSSELIGKVYDLFATFPIQKNNKGEENGDPTTYIPVRLTNGKNFINPSETVVGMGPGGGGGGTTGMITFLYDTVNVTYPSSTVEEYEFKKGSSRIAVVRLTYTSSTKDNLSSVQKL
jgi:hypothetical protein